MIGCYYSQNLNSQLSSKLFALKFILIIDIPFTAIILELLLPSNLNFGMKVCLHLLLVFLHFYPFKYFKKWIEMQKIPHFFCTDFVRITGLKGEIFIPTQHIKKIQKVGNTKLNKEDLRYTFLDKPNYRISTSSWLPDIYFFSDHQGKDVL